MSEKLFVVRLTTDERTMLTALTKKKILAAYKRTRARVLLKIDEGPDGPAWTDEQAAEAYEAFPPAEARRLVEKLEFHYTPKHGSWLNISENELSALTTQCLSRRIGTLEELQQQVVAWENSRNEEGVRVNWRFTMDRAREKLRSVYPLI